MAMLNNQRVINIFFRSQNVLSLKGVGGSDLQPYLTPT